jgi:hypothetical protein
MPVFPLGRIAMWVHSLNGSKELIFRQLANPDPDHMVESEVDNVMVISDVLCTKELKDPRSEEGLARRSMNCRE